MPKLMHAGKFLFLGVALLAMPLQHGNAGVISSAISASGPPRLATYPMARTIDQSGLSIPCLSGVTDLSTYIGLSPTHEPSDTVPNYFVPFTSLPPVLDFDLGSSLPLSQIVFWNAIRKSNDIASFNVHTSNDADFSVATPVGSLTTLLPGDGGGAPERYQGVGADKAPVFDLTDSTARYLRLEVNSVYSETGGGGLMFFEIAFEVSFAGPPCAPRLSRAARPPSREAAPKTRRSRLRFPQMDSSLPLRSPALPRPSSSTRS